MADKLTELPMIAMIRRRQLLMGVAAGALVGGIMPGLAFGDTAAVAAEITPATPLADLKREQQLILGWAIASPIGVTNPWAVPGYTHQEGNVLMWEPLMYFGIFADDYIPWLATSMDYTSADFTALEIKMNPKAKWSDGVAVTAKDVVFTFNGQLKNEKLPYHAAFDQFVDTVTAVEPDSGGQVQDSRAALQVRSAVRKVRHRDSDCSGACSGSAG